MKYLMPVGLALFGALALVGCGRKPLTPVAPWTDIVSDSLCFLATTTDPNGLQLEYTFDWGGGPAFATRRYQSGETAYARHVFSRGQWHEVRVQARNENGRSSAWSAPLLFRRSNPPGADTISGLVRWAVNERYRASVKVTDPDGDSVSVRFVWDGSEGGTWTPLAPSGSVLTDSCLWSATGPHTVKVIARDQGNMPTRPSLIKTVNVSWMAVTWYNCSEERFYTGTPALGAIDGEPAIYCLASKGMDCFGLDGRLRWSAATSVFWGPSASLSADGSRLYVPDRQGLVCLDARTGLKMWILPETMLDGSLECTPALGPDGTIYITIRGSDDYQLCKVKDCGDSAVIQWFVDLGDDGPSGTEAVVGRNGVVYALGNLNNDHYDRLFAVDSTGTLLWIDSTSIKHGATPVIDSRDRLLVADEMGSINCFNPEGSLAWTAVTDGLCAGSTAIGQNDDVIATGCNGAVLVFDSAGRRRI